MYNNSHKKILKVVTDTVDNIVIKRPLLPQPKDMKDIKRKSRIYVLIKHIIPKKQNKKLEIYSITDLNNGFSDGNQENRDYQ